MNTKICYECKVSKLIESNFYVNSKGKLSSYCKECHAKRRKARNIITKANPDLVRHQKKISKKDDLTGRKFGKLECLYHSGFVGQHRKWRCRCDCGTEYDVLACNLLKSQTSCNNCYPTGKDHFNWRGHGDLSGKRYCYIRSQAIIRNIDFKLSKEYLGNLFKKQHGLCALTGEKLVLYSGDSKQQITASLDRINSNEGYIEGNVQWVHQQINYMKLDLDQQKFIEWCNKVTKKAYNE